MTIFDIEASQIENFKRWEEEHDEKVRVEEREKMLDEVENHNLLIRQSTCGWILNKMMDRIPKSIYERELNEEDKGYLKAWECMKEVINDILCISIDEMLEQIKPNK